MGNLVQVNCKKPTKWFFLIICLHKSCYNDDHNLVKCKLRIFALFCHINTFRVFGISNKSTLRKVQKILPYALRSENLDAVLKSYFQPPFWISNANTLTFY